MSTLEKLKKVALTGHSVTLAPQSVIEIADLLGEVKASYASIQQRAEVAEGAAERWQEITSDARDGWAKAIAERDNARTALAASAQGFAECVLHKDRLAEALTNLLADVEAINNALGNNEWGEHCTATQQGQTLEGFITALAGEVTELRGKVKHPAVDAEPIYQLADDGKWYDVEKRIYEENVQAGYQGRIVYSGPATNTTIADMMEGMQVSVDVSTCDADAGNRYFGTVTEVSELDGAKNGYILLVQDAEANFSRSAPATDLARVMPDEKAFRALEQRAEAAEAKMAELAKQEPIGRVERGEANDNNEYPDVRVVCLHDQADWINFQDGTELFLRPAPAANLADLVPRAKPDLPDHYSGDIEYRGMCDGWNSCRAAILRNIEEAK